MIKIPKTGSGSVKGHQSSQRCNSCQRLRSVTVCRQLVVRRALRDLVIQAFGRVVVAGAGPR